MRYGREDDRTALQQYMVGKKVYYLLVFEESWRSQEAGFGPTDITQDIFLLFLAGGLAD